MPETHSTIHTANDGDPLPQWVTVLLIAAVFLVLALGMYCAHRRDKARALARTAEAEAAYKRRQDLEQRVEAP